MRMNDGRKPSAGAERTRGRKILLLRFLGFAFCAGLIGLLYAEENWRGRRAWENCKRRLASQGVKQNWAETIPEPVPADENFFGVPEMQKWFVGRGDGGWNDLSKELSSPTYPGINIDSNAARITVAELTVGLAGGAAPDGAVALRWDDKAASAEAARLVTNAIGPTATAPESSIGVGLMLRRPEEVHAARIFLQCQAAPTEKDLQNFLPDSILRAKPDLSERVLKIEPGGGGSYRLTMPVLARVDDYLAWSDKLEPQFALIRQALLRPKARMAGSYEYQQTVPTPNFVSARHLAQILAARAECHFLLGQPGESLRDLTLAHDFCHPVFEANKPMMWLGAMINSAIRGLYATQVSEGVRLKAWREPQLAVLEEQLKTIQILPPVQQAFDIDRMQTCNALDRNTNTWTTPSSAAIGGVFPAGWGYQKMAARINIELEFASGLDAARSFIFPDKVEAAMMKARSFTNGTPYAAIASLGTINFLRICQNAAHSQTQVNQALIVCALERHRLAHGEYPETLDALSPQFIDKIPRDVIGGQPPHYHRAADGTFILYSMGWGGTDKGGVRGPAFQSKDCDAVWPE